jgi:hypothetical protein
MEPPHGLCLVVSPSLVVQPTSVRRMPGDVVVLRQLSGMPELPPTASVGGIMTVQPEEVGLSSQRLERMRVHFQRYIDASKSLTP